MFPAVFKGTDVLLAVFFHAASCALHVVACVKRSEPPGFNKVFLKVWWAVSSNSSDSGGINGRSPSWIKAAS